MDSDTRSYGIAALSIVLTAAGFAASGLSGLGLPDSSTRTGGIGTVVGDADPFSNAVALSPQYVMLLALVGATVLTVVVTWRDGPLAGRRFLESGSLLGGLAMLPILSTGFSPGWTVQVLTDLPSVRFVSDYLLFAGPSTFLVGLGTLATGTGALVVALGPLEREDRRLLAGTISVVVVGAAAAALTTWYATWPTVFAAGPTYAGVGLYCLALAGLLAAARAVRPEATHWLALPPALAGVVAAVFGLLDGAIRGGTLAALIAVVTLWTFWTLAPRDWSALETPDRGTESTS